MESRHENVKLIDEAIKRLLEERRNREVSGDGFFEGEDDKDDHLLLSGLLSQLESMKGNSEEIVKAEPGEVTETSEGGELKSKNGGDEELDKEKIVKELNNLKRQNTITHWLLSAMLVMIIAWQASEVTLLLKLKHGLSHPFSYVGSLLGSFFSGGSDQTQTRQDEKQLKSDAFPNLKMPELPSVELPDVGLSGELTDRKENKRPLTKASILLPMVGTADMMLALLKIEADELGCNLL